MHFNKLTTGHSVFTVSVIVYSNCHVLQFSRQLFSVSTLLIDDAFMLATPLTNGVISETLWQFAPISDISQGSVATHLRFGGIFSDGIVAFFPNFDSETISKIG